MPNLRRASLVGITNFVELCPGYDSDGAEEAEVGVRKEAVTGQGKVAQRLHIVSEHDDSLNNLHRKGMRRS